MVRKSYGKMKGTRGLKSPGKLPVTRYLKKFSVGDTVHIDLVTSSTFPHPRFHGRTGKIVEKRGDAYSIVVRDGKKMKTVFLKPEHLKTGKR